MVLQYKYGGSHKSKPRQNSESEIVESMFENARIMKAMAADGCWILGTTDQDI